MLEEEGSGYFQTAGLYFLILRCRIPPCNRKEAEECGECSGHPMGSSRFQHPPANKECGDLKKPSNAGNALVIQWEPRILGTPANKECEDLCVVVHLPASDFNDLLGHNKYRSGVANSPRPQKERRVGSLTGKSFDL
ncbi:hypothetical protein CDAR_296891 [Caerostris darwini]|uniref:Uncharacterized protein n=1 Tax=Caerostris darwini TaxID=1538125 RepID=A0AAV4NAA3_9ARAC|nr:hypothetical protein CDAR_296891 [Caerostris darwini]